MRIFIIITLLFFNLLLLKYIGKKKYGVYLAKLLYLYYIIQIIVGLIIILLDYDSYLPECHLEDVYIRDILPLWSLSTLLAGLSIYSGIKLATLGSRKNNNSSIVSRCKLIFFEYPIERISKIFAIIFLLSVIFPFIPQFPYVLRVITLSFDFLPIFIGIYFLKLSRQEKVKWIILLSLNMFANLIQGSRGLAVIPLGLFCIGYLISIRDEAYFRKRIYIILLLGIPFMSFFGKIHDFREKYGRGNDITTESFSLLINFLINNPDNSSETYSDKVVKGLTRFVSKGDFAILYFTPDRIPHRSFVQVSDELKSMVTLYGSEGSADFRKKRDTFKYGSGVLTEYGFSVNENTSVGLGVLGDSYSRFGFCGIVVYMFILSFVITKMELITIYKKNALFGLLLFLFLSYTFLYTLYGNSYFIFFKKIIFNGVLVYFVCKLITIRYKKI